MAIKIKYITKPIGTILLVLLGSISLSSAIIDCDGKAFHCVNTTHFMICVDFGGGVSTTVNDYIVSCPPATECRNNNYFECEYPAPTTPAAIVVSSDVTNEVLLKNSSSASTLSWEEIITTNLPQGTTSEKTTLNTVSPTTLMGVSVTTEVIPIVSDRDLTNHSVSDIKSFSSNNTLDIHRPNNDTKITTESGALQSSTTSLNFTETGLITIKEIENTTNTSVHLTEPENVTTATILTTERPTEQVTIYSNSKYNLSEIVKETSSLNHLANIDNNGLLPDSNTPLSEQTLLSKTVIATEHVTLQSNHIKDTSTVTHFNNNIAEEFTSDTKDVEVIYPTRSSILLPEQTTSHYDAYVSTKYSLKETVTTNTESTVVSSNTRVGNPQEILINSTSTMESDKLLSINNLNISAELIPILNSTNKISNEKITDPLRNTSITNLATGNPLLETYTKNITPHPIDESVITSTINIDLVYELFNNESTQTEDYSISTLDPETFSITSKQLDEFSTTISIHESIALNKSLEMENSVILLNDNSTVTLDVLTTVNPLDDILLNTLTQNGDNSVTTISNSNNIVENTSTEFIQREKSSLTTILDITNISSNPENVESNGIEQSKGFSPIETTNLISDALNNETIKRPIKTGQVLSINNSVASILKPERLSLIQLNTTPTEETSTIALKPSSTTEIPRETKEHYSTTIMDVKITNSDFKILNNTVHIEESQSASTANRISNPSNSASISLDMDKEFQYTENTELNKSKQTGTNSKTFSYVENIADSLKNKTLLIDQSSSLLKSTTTANTLEKRPQTNRPIQNSKYSTINIFDTETTTNPLVNEILNETLDPQQLSSTQIYTINTNHLDSTTNPTEAGILDGPTHTEQLFLTTLMDVVTTINPSEYEIVNKTLTFEQQCSTRLNTRTTNRLENITSDRSTQTTESSTTLYKDKPSILLKNTEFNETKEIENYTSNSLNSNPKSNHIEGGVINVPIQTEESIPLKTKEYLTTDVVSTINPLEGKILNKTKKIEQPSPRINLNTTVSNPSENILLNISIQTEVTNLLENIELNKFKLTQNSSLTVLDDNPILPISSTPTTQIEEFSLTTLIDMETITNPTQSQILNKSPHIEQLPFTRFNSSKTTNPFEGILLNETTETEKTPLKVTLETDNVIHALEKTEVNNFYQNEATSTTILDMESTANFSYTIGTSNLEILNGSIQIEEFSTINPLNNIVSDKSTQIEEPSLTTMLYTDKAFNLPNNTELNTSKEMEKATATASDTNPTSNPILDGSKQIEELFLTTLIDVETTTNPLKDEKSNNTRLHFQQPSLIRSNSSETSDTFENILLDKTQTEKSSITLLEVDPSSTPLENKVLNKTLQLKQPSSIMLNINTTSNPLENILLNRPTQIEESSLTTTLNVDPVLNIIETGMLNKPSQVHESSTEYILYADTTTAATTITNTTTTTSTTTTLVNEVQNKILALEQTSSTRLNLSNPNPLESIVPTTTTQITEYSLTTILSIDNEFNLLNHTELNKLKQFGNSTAMVLDANTTSNHIEAGILNKSTQTEKLSLTTFTNEDTTINPVNKISNKTLLYLEKPLSTTQTGKHSVLLDINASFNPLEGETLNLNTSNNPLENILLNRAAQNEESSLTTTLDQSPTFNSIESEILKKPTQTDEFSTIIVDTETTMNPFKSTQIEESLTTILYTEKASNVTKNTDINKTKETEILTSTNLGANSNSSPIQVGILAESTQIEGFALSTPINMETTTNPLENEILNKTSKQLSSTRLNVNTTSDRLDNIPIKRLTQTEELVLTTTQDTNKVVIFLENTELNNIKQIGDSSFTTLGVNPNLTETGELLNRPTQINEYAIPDNETSNKALYTEELNSTLMSLSKLSASTTKFITETTASSLLRQNSSPNESRIIEKSTINSSKNVIINFSESTPLNKQIERNGLSSGKIFDVKPVNHSLENLVEKSSTLPFNVETITEDISFKIPTPSYRPQQTVVSTYSTYIEVPPVTTSSTKKASLSVKDTSTNTNVKIEDSLTPIFNDSFFVSSKSLDNANKNRSPPSVLTTSLGVNYVQSTYPETSTTAFNELVTTTKSKSVDTVNKNINEESKNNDKISNGAASHINVKADLFHRDKLQFDIKNMNKKLDESNIHVIKESSSLHTNDTITVNMANDNFTIVNNSSIYAPNPVTLPIIESTTRRTDNLTRNTDLISKLILNITKEHTHKPVYTERTYTLRHVTTIKSDLDDRNNKSNNGEYNFQNDEKLTYQQFNCRYRTRGRYADQFDCKKFYVCIGRQKPIIGVCPDNTVFSDIRKQCTKNLFHCIRENQFQCVSIGKFSDFLNENVYYICIKNAHGAFVRFKFQCQRGYRLNKNTVKCIQNSDATNRSVSNSSRKDSEKTIEKDSKEERSNSREIIFECEKEGKFFDPTDCRRYYVCTKNKKSTFRRRRKKCHSNEIFHKDKKKCVDNGSHECGSM